MNVYVLPKPSAVAPSEWILNLAGVALVTMAGLARIKMSGCIWKDDSVRHYKNKVMATNSSPKDIFVM